jgi:hypothetical protein
MGKSYGTPVSSISGGCTHFVLEVLEFLGCGVGSQWFWLVGGPLASILPQWLILSSL